MQKNSEWNNEKPGKKPLMRQFVISENLAYL